MWHHLTVFFSLSSDSLHVPVLFSSGEHFFISPKASEIVSPTRLC
jgi:hypothetical protein